MYILTRQYSTKPNITIPKLIFQNNHTPFRLPNYNLEAKYCQEYLEYSDFKTA